MRSLLVGIFFLFSGLQYPLWFGASGIINLTQLQKKLDSQIATNQKIIISNKSIERDIADLKSGTKSLEERARFELGLTKEDEIFYQVLDS